MPSLHSCRRGVVLPAALLLACLTAQVSGTPAASAAAAPGSPPGEGSAPQVAAAAVDARLTPVGSPFAGSRYDGRIGDISAATIWSSAAVADVTGDAVPEVVTSGLDGFVRVWTTSGAPVTVADMGPSPIYGSPAVGDVSGDGIADVTVGNANNSVASYSFVNGRAGVLFYRTEPARVQPGPTGIFSTPALADLDGDGRLDIVTSSWGQTLDAFSVARGGTHLPGWPQWLLDTIWSSPAVGDVDADGALDVVVGGDCEGSGQLQPCWGTSGGGHVWAFNRDGSLKWRSFVGGQTVWSSPTLVDLNGDGAQDVVVGTGLFWPDPAGRAVMAFDGRNGALLWRASAPGRVAGSPSVADVDGDGRPEIYIVAEGATLLALRADGSRMWQACIDSGARCPAGAGTFGGAALADIDADGRVEAVVQGDDRLRVFDAASGALETTVANGAPYTVFSPNAPPTIASVNGRAHIFQTGMGDANGNRRRDVGDRLDVLAWTTGQRLGAAPWPTFKGGSARTSAVPLPAIDRAETERFVRSLYRDFLGRAADPTGLAHWTGAIVDRRLTRYQVTLALAGTDEWVSTVVRRFYRDTLGREADPVGLADWVGRIQNGVPVAYVASAFYASQEYYVRISGGTPSAWVADLYPKLLGRPADPVGLRHWTDQLGAGVPRTTITGGFYGSTETLRRRVDTLYRSLLGRPADPAGLGTWPPFVLAQGDLSLAAALAASPEYYARAQSR